MAPLINLLLTTKEILDNHGIFFWLDSGTLLGAIRNNELLSWEHDIDISIWATDMPNIKRQAVICEFKDKGYRILDTSHYTTIAKDGVWIDLCYYTLNNGNALIPVYVPINTLSHLLCNFRTILQAYTFYAEEHPIAYSMARFLPSSLRGSLVALSKKALMIVGYNTWIIPQFWFDYFTEMKLYDASFNVPLRYVEYLEYRYGKNWKTPVKNWNNNNDGGLTRV